MGFRKLTLGQKIGFGIGDVGGNALFTIMAFWLMNYFTDHVGLSAALAGTAMMIGRIFDALIDPLIGYFSDRTRTRWGRRRPYIFIGAILVLISLTLTFTNPGIKDQGLLFIWAISVYCFLNLAYSLLNVPYSSLTPELTHDYHERTSLNGYRMTFAMIGTFLGAGLALPLLGIFDVHNGAKLVHTDTGYTMMALIFGIIILIVSMVTFFTVRETAQNAPKPKTGMLKSYLTAFRNKPYLMILFPWVFYITAMTIVSGSLIYYFKYVYHAEGMTTLAILMLLGTALLSIPLWVWISKKIGKKLTFSIGMLIVAAVGIVAFFFAHKLGMNFMFGLMVIGGFGISPTYVMPWAIIPDTIEYDYVQTGERREGTYYGLWTFMSKLGQAVANFLIGWVLAASGYLFTLPSQPDSVIFGIRLLFGPLMAGFYIIGAIWVLFYPITQKKYEEIRAQAEKMEAAERKDELR